MDTTRSLASLLTGQSAGAGDGNMGRTVVTMLGFAPRQVESTINTKVSARTAELQDQVDAYEAANTTLTRDLMFSKALNVSKSRECKQLHARNFNHIRRNDDNVLRLDQAARQHQEDLDRISALETELAALKSRTELPFDPSEDFQVFEDILPSPPLFPDSPPTSPRRGQQCPGAPKRRRVTTVLI